MEKYDFKKEDVKIHNIIYAITTPKDYEMERFIFLEDLPGCEYDEFVIVEGYHCSCYNFDETEWEAIKYNEQELKKLAIVKCNEGGNTIKQFWNYINDYIEGR